MAGIQSNPDAPQSLSIGEISSTMMMCDESLMEQEATYLSRLGNVTSWSFDAGRLALIYEMDGNFGSLLFEAVQ
jgi:heat shock protein HslJ